METQWCLLVFWVQAISDLNGDYSFKESDGTNGSLVKQNKVEHGVALTALLGAWASSTNSETPRFRHAYEYTDPVHAAQCPCCPVAANERKRSV